MACFLVPAAEAVVTTALTKAMEKKEKETAASGGAWEAPAEQEVRLPFSRKMKWLNHLLWGGSALLALEHVWHGEIIPAFPFLTAASDPVQFSQMLQEMSTTGVAMAALVTAFWAGMLAVVSGLEKRTDGALPEKR